MIAICFCSRRFLDQIRRRLFELGLCDGEGGRKGASGERIIASVRRHNNECILYERLIHLY